MKPTSPSGSVDVGSATDVAEVCVRPGIGVWVDKVSKMKFQGAEVTTRDSSRIVFLGLRCLRY